LYGAHFLEVLEGKLEVCGGLALNLDIFGFFILIRILIAYFLIVGFLKIKSLFLL
jgi:hypothetical protein